MNLGIKVFLIMGFITTLAFQNCSEMSATKKQYNTITPQHGDSGDNGNSGDNGGNGNVIPSSCYDPVTAQTISHGSSVQVYANNTVSCGQSCQNLNNLITKTCNDGSFYNNGNSIPTNTGFSTCTPPPASSCTVTTPTSCTDSITGVTANIGEIRRFYLNQSVSCGQSCNSSTNYIDKRCQLIGQTAQFIVITNTSSSIENYRFLNCTTPSSTTCSGGGGGGSGGSTTLFQQPGCVAPSQNIGLSNFSDVYRSRWPAKNAYARLYNDSVIKSMQFTASSSSSEFGTYTASGHPEMGEESHIILSISKTPGCIERTKLPNNCVILINEVGGITWSNAASAYACKLTPGENYYLNIFWGTTTPHSSGAHCPTGNCSRDFGN